MRGKRRQRSKKIELARNGVARKKRPFHRSRWFLSVESIPSFQTEGILTERCSMSTPCDIDPCFIRAALPLRFCVIRFAVPSFVFHLRSLLIAVSAHSFDVLVRIEWQAFSRANFPVFRFGKEKKKTLTSRIEGARREKLAYLRDETQAIRSCKFSDRMLPLPTSYRRSISVVSSSSEINVLPNLSYKL